MIKRLCIIGVGLIGGSLARALRGANAVEQIVGASRNEEHLQEALELGVIDGFTTDLAKAVEGADVIFISVPLGAMRKVFEAIKDSVGADTIITDAGSAKASVIADVEAAFGGIPENFVAGHPIAGTEQSGVEASFAELYQGRKVILTPTEKTATEATAKIREMWEATGASVQEMSVDHHDEILAATSHVPHVLAFALVDSLAKMKSSHEVFDYAAGGFRDFTRIASSDPAMWRDICSSNRDAIVSMIDRFRADLDVLSEAIQNNNEEQILQIFKDAKKARDEFVG